MGRVVAYVIIPGIDGSDEQHWQTVWERQRSGSAVRISPTSWSEPDLDDWVGAVQAAYDQASRHDSQVVLVAHSLGCWAASTWLNRNTSRPTGSAFLVAPPDPRGPAFPRQTAPTFAEVSAQPLLTPTLVVGSSNDAYCTPEAAVDLTTRWGARWHLAGAVGHINSAAGLGPWQQGRELLTSLTSQ
ncbi:alpha/beta fold hydrolase [Streptomyces sp. NPDC048277]|uniref:RBBP9/YdeN family alpha/beta hydrolase n=1 Tax=Streptomyces sp. NPDC048277 TaxID=3155027 RepID=UPI0033F4660D